MDIGTVIFLVIIVCIVGCLVESCTKMITRSRNIVAQGWPPEHCDADGDQVG